MAYSIFLQEDVKVKWKIPPQCLTYYRKSKVSDYKLDKGNKNPILFQIEKEFSNYFTNSEGMNIYKLASDKKAVAKIEELFVKKFNLSSFTLNLVTPNLVELIAPMNMIYPNAYTFGSTADLERFLKAPPLRTISNINYEKGDIKFKNPCQNSFITVYPSLSLMLNPEELVAIILHEIGHDFYEYGPIGSILGMFFVPIRMAYSYISKGIYAISGFIRDKILNSEFNRKFFTTLFHSYNNTNSETFNVFMLKALTFISLITNPMNLLSILTSGFLEGYSNEEYADNFAREHGYSTGLASAMNKIHRMFESGNDHNRFSRATEILGCLNNLIFLPFEEHPQNYSRILNSYKYLEEEFKKEKNPKIRKIILNDKKNTEKILNDFKKNSSDFAINYYGKVDYLKHNVFTTIFGTEMSDLKDKYTEEKKIKKSVFL